MSIDRPARLGAAGALTAALWATAALAQPADVSTRLEALEAQLRAQQATIARQQAELDSLRAQVAGAPVATASGGSPPPAQAAPSPPADDRIPVLAGPSFTRAAGGYSLSVRGLSQLDYGWHDQAAPGSLATDFRRGSVGSGGRETEAARDLSNGANFRRARLGVDGTFNGDLSFRMMIEFGGSGMEGPARINDAWVAYSGLAPLTVQLGAFAPPANLDDSTSPDDQVFIERASSSELSRALAGGDGRVGFGLRGSGARWFASGVVTGPTFGDEETFDEQLGFVGRAAWLAATGKAYDLQIGVSGTHVFRPDHAGAEASPRYPVRFRDRPEVRLDSTRLVDTGAIDARHASVAGLEAAGRLGPVWVQAEHFWYGVNRRDSAFADPRFSGGYVAASWVLTGEGRRRNAATASFQDPVPRRRFAPGAGDWGSLELGVRYSWLDLDFMAGAPGTPAPPGAVRGGRQNIWTTSLNWRLNVNAKVQFDWLHVDVARLNPAGPGDPTPFGAAPATPPLGVEIGQSFDVYALRTQFSF